MARPMDLIVLLPRARRPASSWALTAHRDLRTALPVRDAPRRTIWLRTWAFSGPGARVDVEVDDAAGPLVEADGPQFEYLTLEEREAARAALRRGERPSLPTTTTHWRRTARNTGSLPKLDELVVIRLGDLRVAVQGEVEGDFVDFELWVTTAPSS